MYTEGKREIIYFQDVPQMFINEKYQTAKVLLAPDYQKQYNALMRQLNASKFPEIQKNDFERIQKGTETLLPSQFSSLIATLSKAENITKFGLNADSVKSLKENTSKLMTRISQQAVPLNLVLQFVSSDSPDTKVSVGSDTENFMPTKNFSLKVDKAKVIKNGTVAESDGNQILNEITWTHPRNYLRKGELMVLDLLAANNWERPVYFAVTVGSENYMNLDQYFQLEGMAYRLVPIKSSNQAMDRGRINSDILYKNLIDVFKWGNVNSKDVYLDENNLRMLMNIKSNFARLADKLNAEGKKDKALEVLKKCNELMPPEKVTPSYYNLLIAEQYYKMGENELGNSEVKTLANVTQQELQFFFELKQTHYERVSEDAYRSIAIAQEMVRIVRQYKQNDLNQELSTLFLDILRKLEIISTADRMQTDEKQFFQWYQGLSEENKQLISVYVFFMEGTQNELNK